MNRARIITTREGRFINVNDIKEALRDDAFINEKLVPLLKIGHEKGDKITTIIRVICGSLIYESMIGGLPEPPSAGKTVATKGEDIPDFETCIKQICLHLDHYAKTYIEIALDPNTNEIGWSFAPTTP